VLACVAADDQQTYRDACRDLVLNIEQTGEINELREVHRAFWTTSICCMGTDALEDYEPIVALTDRHFGVAALNPGFRGIQGIALYRAGRPTEAMDILKITLPAHALALLTPLGRANAETLRISQTTAAMFLAAAQRDSGQNEEAQKTLMQVHKFIEEIGTADPSGNEGLLPWANRFAVLVLTREIERFEHPSAEASP
jgi:hypothetical protein